MAAYVCWRLYRFTGQKPYQQRAQAIVSCFQGQVVKDPLEYPFLLTTQILLATPPLDITVVGDPQQDQVREMLKEIYARYLPERRLVLKNPQQAAALEKVIPQMRDYTRQGGGPRPTSVGMPCACRPSPGQRNWRPN